MWTGQNYRPDIVFKDIFQRNRVGGNFLKRVENDDQTRPIPIANYERTLRAVFIEIVVDDIHTTFTRCLDRNTQY